MEVPCKLEHTVQIQVDIIIIQRILEDRTLELSSVLEVDLYSYLSRNDG